MSELLQELFIVEAEDGEMLDDTGEGGFTVWSTRAEAQDALDSRCVDGESMTVVRFVRDANEMPEGPKQ